MSDKEIIKSGLFLYIGSIGIIVTGLLFWLVISRIADVAEVGYSVTVISISSLVAAIITLAIEYPLMQDVHKNKKAYGTALIFVLIITAILAPIILLILGTIYEQSLDTLTIIMGTVLLITAFSSIPKYAMIGILRTGTVLIIETSSIVIRFIVGVTLVFLEYPIVGIVSSAVAMMFFQGIIYSIIAHKNFGFSWGGFGYLKSLLKRGLANITSKISNVVIINLGVALLGILTIDPEAVALFYIALMFSVVASGLSFSLATIAIPVSSKYGIDKSDTSNRIGLALTIPLIAGLISTPQFVLSIVGTNYVEADLVLIILSLAVIPTILTTNAITKFNNLKNLKKLTFTGIVEISVFIFAFFVLVPLIGMIGAAIAIILAYTASSIFAYSNMWNTVSKSLAISLVALFMGWLVAEGLAIFIDFEAVLFITAIVTSFSLLLITKVITFQEITSILKRSNKRR